MRVSWDEDRLFVLAVSVFLGVLISGAVVVSLVSYSVWDAQQHPCAVRVK